MRSATQAASFTSSEMRATWTSPGPFSSHGTSRLSGSGRCAAGSCPIRTSAASRIRAPERKLVYRGSLVASSPSAFANCFGNSSRLNSDAPAPGVDVLIGVADRRHRMTAAEDTRHQPGLRDVRVLVLVEEHRGEPVAILLRDLGMLLHDVERELDLIAEVDHAELALQLAEDRARLRELDALPRGSVRAIGAMVLELLEPLFVELDDLVGRTEVVGRLIVEREDPVDDTREPLGLDDLERHPIEDPPAELDPLRRREDPLVRLDADQDAVAVEELGREPVVVADLGFLAVGEVEAGQRPADPLLEVLRRLVGEGEAEHVAGKDALLLRGEPAERDQRQVDDARGHHRGLARTRRRRRARTAPEATRSPAIAPPWAPGRRGRRGSPAGTSSCRSSLGPHGARGPDIEQRPALGEERAQ